MVPLSVEWLDEQIAAATRQTQAAYEAYHQALGALSMLKQLLELARQNSNGEEKETPDAHHNG